MSWEPLIGNCDRCRKKEIQIVQVYSEKFNFVCQECANEFEKKIKEVALEWSSEGLNTLTGESAKDDGVLESLSAQLVEMKGRYDRLRGAAWKVIMSRRRGVIPGTWLVGIEPTRELIDELGD